VSSFYPLSISTQSILIVSHHSTPITHSSLLKLSPPATEPIEGREKFSRVKVSFLLPPPASPLAGFFIFFSVTIFLKGFSHPQIHSHRLDGVGETLNFSSRLGSFSQMHFNQKN
jgi:hypothetical protein